jgi:DNA-binding response OmpR family regulator
MQASPQVVLVVDDHYDTANVISEMLQMSGYTSHSAYSGLEALRLYEPLRPSLVITDETLTDSVTGSDLLRVLRHKYGTDVGRAVFLTGAPKMVTCLPTDLILEKPVDFETLLAAVRAILGEPPAARKAD